MVETHMPLATPVKVETCEDEAVETMASPPDPIMCFWKMKRTLDTEPDFCTHESKDFMSLIEHLRVDDNANVDKYVDYCLSCEIMFESPLQAIHHYLSKILNFEGFEMVREYQPIEDQLWMDSFFDHIKNICEEVMDRLIYQETFPYQEGPYQEMPPLEEVAVDANQAEEEAEPVEAVINGRHVQIRTADEVGDYSPDPFFRDVIC